MDARAQRGSRGRGRSPRHASSARLVAAASTAGTGSAGTSPAATPERLETAEPATGSTYRLLIHRGLTADEAASLTAFMCGIPISDLRWSMRQVNQLLFLRAMVQTGRYGRRDGGTARPN